MSRVVAGLDVGTNKVIALIGSVHDDGKVDIIGVGSCRSSGLRRGAVINIDATSQSVKSALQEAERMAGVKVTTVSTGVSGSHIRGCNSRGIVAIKDREVTQGDLERVMDTAKTLTIPSNHKIIHVIPQEFILDGHGGVREPIGMSGVRLEVLVHVVTGSVSAIQNIVKSIERCKVKVDNVILQPLASSAAVVNDDERELGCVLVDIGGGTTDIAIFVNGTVQYTAVIPIAGDQATNDIAIAFRLPARHAEQLKLNYASLVLAEDNNSNGGGDGGRDSSSEADHQSNSGSVAVSHSQADDIVTTEFGESSKTVSRSVLTQVLYARYRELFNLVNNEVKRSGLATHINAGVILAGGASRIAGVTALAEQVLGMPVRIGVPKNIGGLVEHVANPIYATGVGLLLMAAQRLEDDHQQEQFDTPNATDYELDQEDGATQVENNSGEEQLSMWERIKNWVKINF